MNTTINMYNARSITARRIIYPDSIFIISMVGGYDVGTQASTLNNINTLQFTVAFFSGPACVRTRSIHSLFDTNTQITQIKMRLLRQYYVNNHKFNSSNQTINMQSENKRKRNNIDRMNWARKQ